MDTLLVVLATLGILAGFLYLGFQAGKVWEYRRWTLTTGLPEPRPFPDPEPCGCSTETPPLSDPEPDKGNLPENVAEALKDYVEARLQANGNTPLSIKQIMIEFAKWHGPKNLERGILRPEPPPIPERTLLDVTKPAEA
jgi:hypothetical protein